MEKLSYENKILKTLEDAGGWVYGYQLEQKNTPYGWVGDSGKRRCRAMMHDKKYKKKIEKRIYGKYVQYRAKQTSKPKPPPPKPKQGQLLKPKIYF